MSTDFAPVFAALKPVLAKHAKRLAVKTDKAGEYAVVTKSPSPFPQHKGQPMWVGSIRVGKAYVSFHLLPIYMAPELTRDMSPALKKRMQGKACFNFKAPPEPELIAELHALTEAALRSWLEKKWL
jgi:hypothetical protein